MINSVNIIIACHDSEKYLAEAVESVVNQTCKNFDITIVDDGSADRTKEIAESLIEKYLYYNIELLYTPDVGASVARTVALSNKKDKYILFLDGDDKIHPQFLEKTIRVLEETPSIAFAYTDTQLFGNSDECWIQPEYNFNRLLDGNYICYCSLIRREHFDFVGGFDLNNRNYHEDYENWINLGRHGLYGKHIPEKLFYYRVRSDSHSQGSERFHFVYKSYIILKYPEIFDPTWIKQAQEIFSKYPSNFMSLKKSEQEKIINE